MRVLINAGPWLPVPPHGYGGIENVIATLAPPLRELGVEVVLATVGDSDLPVDEQVSAFGQGQFARLQEPYNRVCGIVPAHQHAVRRRLQRGDIDLVHDHVEAAGLVTYPSDIPVLHTLHWDLTKHPSLYGALDAGPRLRVNGVSADQLTHAPAALRAHAVGHVHLATPLAGQDVRTRPVKGRHVVVLGRITPGKGQDLAARLAHEHGFDLVLAGPVGPYHRPGEPMTNGDNPDVRFWREDVAPHVDGRRVRWIGTVTGAERDELVATARAALFPLRWNEPGGTAVVESLALGTPVVGIARGCLPELVGHEHTGLLTSDEEELGDLVRKASAISPDECRSEAARRFTPAVMAGHYLRLYEQVRSL
jgi:glycosyltransferase involved in cell wall biosynthesis